MSFILQIADQGETAAAVSTAVSTALSTALATDVTSAAASTAISTALSTALAGDVGGGGVTSGAIFGLTLSNDGGTPNTILDVAAGSATDSTNATSLALASAFTGSTGGTFVAATGNAKLDTGTIGTASWYHVFIISKAAGASPDILFSLSATAPTMPATYTLFRRIGSFLTAGSNIVAFSQFGDDFRWMVQVNDHNLGGLGDTLAHLEVMSTPLGVKTIWKGLVYVNAATEGVAVLATSPDDTDQACGTTGNGPFTVIADVLDCTYAEIRTNTASQIRLRNTAGSFNNLAVHTIGWIDTRGRFG